MFRTPIDARRYRDMYSNLETRVRNGDADASEVKAAIDQAWNGIADAFKSREFIADNSDGAEAMIGLITCYFIESNPSFRPMFAAVPVEA